MAHAKAWRGVAWRGMAWHTLPYRAIAFFMDHNPRFEIAQNKHHLTVSSSPLASPRLVTPRLLR